MTKLHIIKSCKLKPKGSHIPIPSFQGEKSNLQRETAWVQTILIPDPRFKSHLSFSQIINSSAIPSDDMII